MRQNNTFEQTLSFYTHLGIVSHNTITVALIIKNPPLLWKNLQRLSLSDIPIITAQHHSLSSYSQSYIHPFKWHQPFTITVTPTINGPPLLWENLHRLSFRVPNRYNATTDQLAILPDTHLCQQLAGNRLQSQLAYPPAVGKKNAPPPCFIPHLAPPSSHITTHGLGVYSRSLYTVLARYTLQYNAKLSMALRLFPQAPNPRRQ